MGVCGTGMEWSKGVVEEYGEVPGDVCGGRVESMGFVIIFLS